jgi:hypothetical protein
MPTSPTFKSPPPSPIVIRVDREVVVTPEDENGVPVVLRKASISHKTTPPPPRVRSPIIVNSALDDDDEDEDDEGNAQEEIRGHRRYLSIPHSLFRRLSTTSQMSLPRANYDPRRVCLNPFPELTLGKHKRTIGVYLAGALVRLCGLAPR